MPNSPATARLRADRRQEPLPPGAHWTFGVTAMTKLPHDALVFIGDGRKALFLRNAGDEQVPDLRTEQVFADDNPPTREQGTDKPGRSFARANAHRRAGVQQTDWHQLEEQRFAERVAAALQD